MKKALVCGAGGFIGGHLVKKLKSNGYWVRGVDIREHPFAPTQADEFHLLDLREEANCKLALKLRNGNFDEVYQLATDMGGMEYIHSSETQIMHNNSLINIHMIHNSAAMNISRYFFSSSVCIYRDMNPNEPEMKEEDAVPANPDNEYGWEKLYSERMVMAYGRQSKMKVKIARFQNCFGPEGEWQGGREKAPAAICRKVAQAEDGSDIEIWGDGTAIRSYTYITDIIEGICMLMPSELEGPVNIGHPQYVNIFELVKTVCDVAGKIVHIKSVDGPVGVHYRNFSNSKIYSTGWKSKISLQEGIKLTYPWIKSQVYAKNKF